MIDSKQAKLLEDVSWRNITVKKGFKFDGASIPKLFWNVIGSPFTGKYRVAALIHDGLYAAEAYERDICDIIFLEIMKEHGVSWLKRHTMYMAVRAGGWAVWKTHTTQSVEKAKLYVRTEYEIFN